MKIEKFEIEIKTLKTFLELYCKDKHEHQKINNIKSTIMNKIQIPWEDRPVG